jgi:hypothetical protein
VKANFIYIAINEIEMHLNLVFKVTQEIHSRIPMCDNKRWQKRRRAQMQPRAWTRWGGCAAEHWG